VAELGTKKVMEKRERPFGSRVANAVEDGLGLLSRGDQALIAQPGEMLGKCRLAEPDPVGEVTHGQLPIYDQVAHYQEPPLVRERPQQ
jgi:hypothetical protein